ncbi:hypothetical protein Taro_026997, partial [Colocasia esculenta]|nr:hypothetical protein [Colocasia esculenta]
MERRERFLRSAVFGAFLMRRCCGLRPPRPFKSFPRFRFRCGRELKAQGAGERERMGYIGRHGVATLHKYKYSGVDNSLVAKYILQPFWSRCITLTGFIFLMTSALLGYIYSPRLDTAPPRWVHLAHGLLLFLYQTFDAVDGKQARRTNSSSPLGELFDHGCDALACAVCSLSLSLSLSVCVYGMDPMSPQSASVEMCFF